MKEFWNERYGKQTYAYGREPNAYFKSQLIKLTPGKLLLPAEGEGRNAVFAASLGWKVSAFDQSKKGKQKAEILARENNVEIDFVIGELEEVEYRKHQFDAIGLIYAHFPAEVKSKYHKILNTYLCPGGIIIFEAFSKAHLKFNTANRNAGGPKNRDMLFSIEEIQNDFDNYEIIELEEVEVDLEEGQFHKGLSSVLRFVGRKQS